MLRVAIDTGGTFTDFVFQNLESGRMDFWKTLSTPEQPEQAVLRGLNHLTGGLGASLSDVREILLATTVATNAIIERKGAPTGLVTTAGFRDVLIIGRQKRHDQYDLFLEKPKPLVQRRNIVEVRERVDFTGKVLEQLDMDSVDAAIGALLDKGVTSIAVSLLHAYANPLHERAIGEHLRSRAPGISISLSSDVSPKYREYERTSTTTANAYIKPLVARYINSLQEVFAKQGFAGKLYAMQSNGGLITPELAKEYPIRLIESGPSAGVLMCSIVGKREGFSEVLTFDMGGTTAKVGAMEGGEPAITPTIEVDGVNLRKYSGLPLNIPAIELIEIGAGGGSIASLLMGLIRVGPESAGAVPGPICYGKGGERATLTDANLVLGYLDPHSFAGGSMRLDVEGAREGIRKQIAEPLGLSLRDAAWGIHAVANATMERAMRSMSMDRGRDPRQYAMVAFGGAGPLHASLLARALGVPRVIIPWGAGVGSAIGLLEADQKFSVSQTSIQRIVPENAGAIAAIFRELEARIRKEVTQVETAPNLEWRRFAYLRYAGQGYEINIDLPPGEIGPNYVEQAISTFHEAYKGTYGYSQTDNQIEATDWYLTAVVPTGASNAGGGPSANGAPSGQPKQRPVYFHEHGDYIDCPVLDRYAARAGDRINGPAVVEDRESTIVILPGDVAEVRPDGHLIVNTGELP
ncbi:MAG: hydantoinase/oxoprolinase family protein [SAR324 cluster bacterium]|nr:hydantoinase/oxoprolinase family protein [SAR324 cluster bacterium]